MRRGQIIVLALAMAAVIGLWGWLLRTRRKWPRRCGADVRNEFPSPHDPSQA
jgi:hypothetical protein